MNPRVLLFPTLALAAGCSDKLPYEPVPCHGYAPYDSTYRLPSGKDTTVTILREHVCGEPRRYADAGFRKAA